MYIPKKYGESKIDKCPFCGRQAVLTNSQGLPVCSNHKNAVLNQMKCVCGETADLMTGKFGVYFNCLNCGNVNARKIFEMNQVEDASGGEKHEEKIISSPKLYPDKQKEPQKEITIRSDDPDYF